MNAGKNPFRVIAADLNGDGKADLATTEFSAASLAVLFGDGTGQFPSRAAFSTGRRPVGLTAADLDGDNQPDLATANREAARSVTVLLNRGAGQFVSVAHYAAGREANGVAAADVNHDGIVDLLVAHESRSHLSVLLGQGSGAFRIAGRYRGGGAFDLAAGDLNGDGHADVVLADSYKGAATVRLGRGDGTFGNAAVYASGSRPFSLVLADLNHDGKLDVTVANYGGASVAVLLGTGDGRLTPRVRYPMGDPFDDYVDAVVVADLDQDGHLDVAAPGRPFICRGRGDGTLERRLPVFDGFAYTLGGATADFNGDGWPDLAFAEACDEVELDCDAFPARSLAVMLNWTGQAVPPCVVPPVVGYLPFRNTSGRDVRRELASAGCGVGSVSRRYSRKVWKGRVISQRPRPYTVLPNSAPVDLVVSLGRRR